MSNNQEKKDAVVPASGDETAPPTNPFLGACGSIGFLPLLELPPADQTKPSQSKIFDQTGGLKKCSRAIPRPPVESQKEDDFFDTNGGIKNCPGAFPVDELEDTDEAPKMGEQVQQKELDKSREKQE
ncbi:hypothetical protein CEP54_007905 [Fusarium duplospermum]|uniref:Uncharacterized protein n=1 Tax=Fusarium duplospermum TaxID=1325734 RepID=A0A428PYU5_9HYPO|nr:hypothetical protein CEP54_007905 [Fusarium duplospermum]